MQMLSQFETSVRDRLAARPGDEAAAARPAKPASPELRSPARPAGGAESGSEDSWHTISLTTAYGDPVAAEDVTQAEFGAALRRIHDEAIPRASAVIVLDGVTHTRNSFLEFVREFNDWEARQRVPHEA
ncbi:hypothetical protein GCM10028796_39140 [Ramlibacter monticola]|uniref:Uncharacterized protein n=1 Tax=Ramlibacter monticola TaxID=1926872 RepID=A0A937CU60_9BURK|nr:hypothetical protein [Ramlibacter monticola]MBL0393330.1 hypothetical protein [Ramlibacter monticola]